ncbi:polyprenol phosphomannose-dependent alpha 1,6 mannosyltransferase MptB [Sphaerisporangium sp. TRM90804]|uniref:polyprenol phosphomannose-dependent alpha 1,6 mannosyltransferase MptB n=1 Tax=Sphaerisporangium sp. TRM90804 TaxID=3031113 RepID=UPI00244D0C6B|nr:polyprenol phosphomannose-dependent alpha 1,6 mannosyltransferase MptB [Sphaerisporangium sp. TRM90804]MDH2425701.1 polyprenol phosphomannose-dependent alpha 1,6 mannosyltransferase MptB [Sphaerisporangium sp. TRM90804]
MDGDGWGARGWVAGVAVGGVGLAIVLTIAIGALGPSAVVPALPGAGWQPPYSLDARPDGHLVIAMEAAAVVLGAVGLAAALLAVRRGRRPDPRLLLLAGCLAAAVLAFLPPSGSADHLNYAAYGRMAVLGHDPYATGAADLPGDPVARVVEIPWQEEPSVYGPVATAVQALASLVGGESVRLTVFVLALVNATAFVATALLLHRLTHGDRARQARAALLWTVNPLVIYQLVAGMHVDTLAIVFMVGALAAGGGRRWWTAGPLLGLGVAVKVNAGLVALGPAWELRRSPARLAVVAGTAVLTTVAAYLLAGPDSLDQVLTASKSISWATPWHLVQALLQTLFGSGAYRAWIQAGSMLLLVLLSASLLRALRRHAEAGAPTSAPRPAASSLGGAPAGEAAWVATAVVVAWLFSTPYALPWYDGLAFALLALAPVTALDGFAVARTAALSLAYLPARQAAQPPDLSWLGTVVRGQVVPWILLALTAALAWWALYAARGSTPRASAAPRP